MIFIYSPEYTLPSYDKRLQDIFLSHHLAIPCILAPKNHRSFHIRPGTPFYVLFLLLRPDRDVPTVSRISTMGESEVRISARRAVAPAWVAEPVQELAVLAEDTLERYAGRLVLQGEISVEILAEAAATDSQPDRFELWGRE